MHIPDGYLSDPVCALTAAAAAAALGVSVAQLRRDGGTTRGQNLAVVAAGVFAAQMVNFSIDHGTSGHLLGAALAAILLGPWAAMVSMTLVLVAQCCLFGDGGLAALGANTLNMAVVATLSAAAIYTLVGRRASGPRARWLAVIAASFASVMAAALLCSLELAASGTHTLGEVLPAMLAVHLPIAGAEALLTLAVVAALSAAGVPVPLAASESNNRKRVAIGLALSMAVAVLLAPMASELPDGLERTAEDLGFANLAAGNWLPSLAVDYTMPGIAWPALATALAGALGVIAVYLTTLAASRAATCKVRKR